MDADAVDELYLRLLGAREKLCAADVLLPTDSRGLLHRRVLGDAVALIDRVASYHCPQWSKFDMPPLEDPDGGRRGD